MLVSKRDFGPNLKHCLISQAGYRERDIMKRSRWVTTAGNGRYLKFTAPNPDYGKNRFETTKSTSATFDTKSCKWVN